MLCKGKPVCKRIPCVYVYEAKASVSDKLSSYIFCQIRNHIKQKPASI